MEEKEIVEFLQESNFIEGEYSEEAYQDALQSWMMINIAKEDISPDLILGVHSILMKRLNKRIAGKFRKCQVGIMTREGFKEAIHYTKINEELEKLCDEKPMNEIAIKNWHIRFEKIHPFEDGNGRTGRILMNYQRIKLGIPILVIHTGKEQQEYYKWFKQTHKH